MYPSSWFDPGSDVFPFRDFPDKKQCAQRAIPNCSRWANARPDQDKERISSKVSCVSVVDKRNVPSGFLKCIACFLNFSVAEENVLVLLFLLLAAFRGSRGLSLFFFFLRCLATCTRCYFISFYFILFYSILFCFIYLFYLFIHFILLFSFTCILFHVSFEQSFFGQLFTVNFVCRTFEWSEVMEHLLRPDQTFGQWSASSNQLSKMMNAVQNYCNLSLYNFFCLSVHLIYITEFWSTELYISPVRVN
jgi:hypothetical protein